MGRRPQLLASYYQLCVNRVNWALGMHNFSAVPKWLTEKLPVYFNDIHYRFFVERGLLFSYLLYQTGTRPFHRSAIPPLGHSTAQQVPKAEPCPSGIVVER